MGSQGVTGGYMGLQGVRRGYSGLTGVTGGYKRFHELHKVTRVYRGVT